MRNRLEIAVQAFVSVVGLFAVMGSLTGCNGQSKVPGDSDDTQRSAGVETSDQAGSSQPRQNLYFGDLHVHTSISMDAILWGNRLGMEEAYGFAQGQAITLPSGVTTRLNTPLDFVAITDHASSFETTEFCFSQNSYAQSEGLCERFKNPSNEYFELAMKRLRQRPVTRYSGFCGEDENDCLKANAKTWQRVQNAANNAYQPGEFTTFVAYEFSPALPKQGKIHRNVFFRGTNVPTNAVSIYDAATEIDLWKSLKQTCVNDCEYLTVPHNLNLTWGYAFAMQTIDGDLYTDDDLRLRAASEPVAEIFQSKGASECAVGLGATDEECAFEQILQPCVKGAEGVDAQACASRTSFVREGLKEGLAVQKNKGINPFKVGFIGSTDTHNSNPGDTEESDYPGAVGILDDTPEKRYRRDKKRHPRSNRNVLYYNPGGLAAIWAPENTREALFDAMKRKTVYATSGTRIGLSFHAGFGSGEQAAVPMGGDLRIATNNQSPSFTVRATKDVHSANLQRLQIVKGWIEDDEQKEQVRDIACSDGLTPNAETNRCPDNGASANPATCELDNTKGAAELSTVWQDPDFDPNQIAFYYTRVIENPVCRWSTYDALRIAKELKPQVSGQIQERAWSSPIWYTP